MENQSQKLLLKRNCFGTKEWSKTSGICKGCELKEECGKIKARRSE